MRKALFALLFVAGCGDAALNSKTQGESCSASSECGAGLLCDFGQTPPVCAGMSSVPQPDAASDVDSPITPVDGPAVDSPAIDSPAIDAPPDAAPDAAVDAAPDAAADAAPDA
ncbi:MAG TPA: hypothetical protein VGM88_05360 [Kofleriaceae bacterium]|jgi:hypothetical protein